jgi:hypothetical protein
MSKNDSCIVKSPEHPILLISETNDGTFESDARSKVRPGKNGRKKLGRVAHIAIWSPMLSNFGSTGIAIHHFLF